MLLSIIFGKGPEIMIFRALAKQRGQDSYPRFHGHRVKVQTLASNCTGLT